MFKCAVTGKMSKLGEKMNRIVVATRDKVYTQKVCGKRASWWKSRLVVDMRP